MVTTADVLDALKSCKDPELDADIVSIGLIYGINVDVDKVKVTLTMTSPMCPVTSLILADAQLRVEAIPGVKSADIELVWDPLWSPEMMSDDLRYTI
ncbi:MAG: metal-sulfur cluster assembly factor [Candidatus Marsarchaeota archaeon]|jgi:metal-sulfur cluster biosynthetic enzyme|nr:metal-sulfur cluster assembly factor [Candidatus Marsarchaeota archaeon]